MKASRRHELKENDLAHGIGVARDYLDRNGKNLLIGGFIVAAVVAAVAITQRSRDTAADYAWQQKKTLKFDELEEGKLALTSLANIARESNSDEFKLRALIEQGRQSLLLAQMVENPPDAELNERAREGFEALHTLFPDNAMAAGIAFCGLATVEENAFVLDGDEGHKERARGYLARVRDYKALTGMPFQHTANDRLNALDETFEIIAFAPALVDAPLSPSTTTLAPTRITPEGIEVRQLTTDELPPELRERALSGEMFNTMTSVKDAATKQAEKDAEAAGKDDKPQGDTPETKKDPAEGTDAPGD